MVYPICYLLIGPYLGYSQSNAIIPNLSVTRPFLFFTEPLPVIHESATQPITNIVTQTDNILLQINWNIGFLGNDLRNGLVYGFMNNSLGEIFMKLGNASETGDII